MCNAIHLEYLIILPPGRHIGKVRSGPGLSDHIIDIIVIAPHKVVSVVAVVPQPPFPGVLINSQ